MGQLASIQNAQEAYVSKHTASRCCGQTKFHGHCIEECSWPVWAQRKGRVALFYLGYEMAACGMWQKLCLVSDIFF
jgi:hypothetical protein